MSRALVAIFIVATAAILPACDALDCTGDYLFQDWKETSFTSADGGTTTYSGTGPDGGTVSTPYLDLSLAHYGANQSFYMQGCSYYIDIEADDTGEAGTFAFSHPDPNSSGCISLETTQLFSLSCSSLTVSSPLGVKVYAPPPEPDDGGSLFGF